MYMNRDTDTAELIPSPAPNLPALIAHAGEKAAWRFLEFFTVNIHNPNTRAAYKQAAGAFLSWCRGNGITRIEDVLPVHVAGYIEELGKVRKAPTVKQHLACIRMLFDWLVTGQVIPSNPAHAVRGPRHSVMKGSTTVMSSTDATAFLKSMDVSHVVGLRDRALIGVMVYAFARVSAVVNLKVEDYFPLKKRWWLRLQEKGGKVNEMGCHHKLEQFLDEYITAAGIKDDKRGPLFRRPSAGQRNLPANPCRAWTHGTWCAVARKTQASRRKLETILSGPSASPIIWNAAGILTSPSAWPVTPMSKRPSCTTGAAMKYLSARLSASGFNGIGAEALEMYKEIVNWSAVIASGLAAVFWFISCRVRVNAKKYAAEESKQEGWSPAQITTGDDDFVQTAILQARWNRYAAGTSCIAALLQALALRFNF